VTHEDILQIFQNPTAMAAASRKVQQMLGKEQGGTRVKPPPKKGKKKTAVRSTRRGGIAR
jgi:hypothetical protein